MYTVDMAMTATEFRKNLFKVLDSVKNGMKVEVEYKGKTVSISSAPKHSRLAYLIERDSGIDDIPEGTGWSKEFQAEWEDEWKDVLPTKKTPKRPSKR